MLFSPKETGSSLLEFAIIIALVVIGFKVLLSFLKTLDGQNPCGVFESC